MHGQAAKLNQPLLVNRGETAVSHAPFIHCADRNLTLEAVKRAEDGEGVIVRLVERYNQRTRTTLTFDRPLTAAWSCDLMERNEAPLAKNGNELEITVQPNEIITLRLSF